MSILAHGLRLAQRGISVFPCRGDKKPLTEHGFKDASTDKAIITDSAAIEIARFDDFHACAESNILQPDVLDSQFGHGIAPRRQRRGLKRNATSRPVSTDS